jgi:hypothetical protein
LENAWQEARELVWHHRKIGRCGYERAGRRRERVLTVTHPIAATIEEGDMTEDEFREMALSLPGAIEASHMNHPDFRVGGRVFATLRYPRRGWGMIALTPDEQLLVVQAEPNVFAPVNGAWGRGGATLVDLKAARKRSVRTALTAAWRRRAPKQHTRRISGGQAKADAVAATGARSRKR